jgi:hypothetical protein
MHYSNFLQSSRNDSYVVIADVTKVFAVLVFSAGIKYIQIFIKILPTVHAILVGKMNEQTGPHIKLTFFIQ